MTVDLPRLRALRSAAIRAIGSTAWMDWHKAIDAASPALFDELEALRAEVERLRVAQEHPGYVATHNLVNKAIDEERAAIVEMLEIARDHAFKERRNTAFRELVSQIDAIERGDHQPTKEPQR